MKVSIFYGSKSDDNKMSGAITTLQEFGIEPIIHVLSAHRVPEKLVEAIKSDEQNGSEVIIAGAGLSAALPGVIASHTILPVIGVPINAKLGGIDALLSIVQMPKGISVGCVGIDNSVNAAILAIQILSVKYPKLKDKLLQYRSEMKKKI